MPTKTIVIDGPIGNYSFSKQYIRNELSGHSKNPVTVQISSLGGSVDHALNIYDQFLEHGNVTADLSAFVASSATLISLGAKTIRMNENSFYLIHKAMNWVDEWGTMNEDEIEDLISRLEKQKQELAKVTLQLARMYVKKTGKTLEEITDLMKQESWLTADEALEWGFVDEIFAPDIATNYFEDLQLVAMISASGYPAPPRKNNPGQSAQNSQVDEESIFNRLWNRFTRKQSEENSNPKNIVIMKTYENVNAVLGVESLESVDDSVSLNGEQLELVNTALAENNQAVEDARVQARAEAEAERDTANTERDTAISERDTARTNLSDAIAAFDAIDQSVADAESYENKVSAITALLAAKPGTATPGNLDDSDPDAGTSSEVDQDTIDNLPHNKTADLNY